MSKRVYRHPLVVRVTHWVVALAILVLTMSGLQIFMAHPALYASDASVFDSPVLSIYADQSSSGQPTGYVRVGSYVFRTTNLFGWTSDGLGGEAARAFPSWATIPAFRDLADGRRWHIFFAWVLGLCALVYAYWAFMLLPRKRDVQELPETLKEHVLPWKVKPHVEYNPLQKFSYFGIVFVVVPLVIVSGLALSPAVDAWAPWLPAILGGRQFARIWHFIGMWAILAFFVIHVGMVSITGIWNNLRAMITGWFAVEDAS